VSERRVIVEGEGNVRCRRKNSSVTFLEAFLVRNPKMMGELGSDGPKRVKMRSKGQKVTI